VNNKYSVLNFGTKEAREIIAVSFEAAVEAFTGEAVKRPSHQSRGLRMYRTSKGTIGIARA
jgi:hypothetical protein